MIDHSILENIPLFSSLSSEYLIKLSEFASQTQLDEGHILFREGEIADNLYILLEGSIQLLASGPAEQQTIVEILHPGDTFILAAALTRKPYLMSAKTLEASCILSIPSDVLIKLTRDGGDFALNILASLSCQFRTMVRHIKDQRLRTTTQRVGAYLLELLKAEGNGNRVVLPYPKRLMASWLGMTPEGLSRSFTTLRQYGVKTESNRVYIKSPAKLRRYCGFDETMDLPDKK